MKVRFYGPANFDGKVFGVYKETDGQNQKSRAIQIRGFDLKIKDIEDPGQIPLPLSLDLASSSVAGVGFSLGDWWSFLHSFCFGIV